MDCSRRTILAVDAGTSSVKGVLAQPPSEDTDWVVISSTSRQLPPPLVGDDGSAEQDASLWWDAALAVMRELLPTDICARRSIRAISLSGQMQSVLLADTSGAPIRPAILYLDSRAEAEANEIESEIGIDRIRDLTNWKGAVSVLPKLLWLHR
jgi:xylulokinase